LLPAASGLTSCRILSRKVRLLTEPLEDGFFAEVFFMPGILPQCA